MLTGVKNDLIPQLSTPVPWIKQKNDDDCINNIVIGIFFVINAPTSADTSRQRPAHLPAGSP
jgi:hypothetical protein